MNYEILICEFLTIVKQNKFIKFMEFFHCIMNPVVTTQNYTRSIECY
jgi:hypothetical protein